MPTTIDAAGQSRQVQVPHSYFQKAKTEYSDWRWATVREFVQNSYDAQANKIDFRLTLNSAGRIELVVIDDGVGMDQDVLENVLLCMGGSRKPHGAIGGFGYAKAILFFAHHCYSIRTQNLLVVGSGGEYRLTTEDIQVPGTRIVVELDDDPDMFEAWRDGITTYVAACYMEYTTGRAVEISLDGQVLEQNNDRSYDYGVRSVLGDIWYDEVPNTSRSAFVVSVQGLPMFTEFEYSSTNESALVGGLELGAGSAALTANRDGFTSGYSAQFSEVVGNLVENHSAVRYGQALDLLINFDKGSTTEALKTDDGETLDAEAIEPRSPLLMLTTAATDQEQTAGYAAALARIRHERYPASFHLKVASLSARRSANSQAYITAPTLVAEMNKARSARLAHMWHAAVLTILNCDWALANGAEFCDAGGRAVDDWSIHGDDTSDLQAFFRGRRVDAGYCFIANTEGLCALSPGEGPHRIYVNPLLLTTESSFRLGDALDLAYHEVAHLWEQHHGESFCGVEAKLRQSVRRWMSEREFLARLAVRQRCSCEQAHDLSQSKLTQAS
jgi:hypothetical protein